MKKITSKRKILFIIIISALLVIAIGAFLYLIYSGKIKPLAAGETANLSLSPATGTYDVGSTFNVDIVLNTGGKAVDATDIYFLNYDVTALEVQDADTTKTGIQIQPGTIFTTYTGNNVDPTLGKISLSGLSQGSSYTGTGVFAKITFKALKVISGSPVTFNFTLGATNDCNVVQSGTFADVLGSVTNGNYTLQPPPTTFNVSFNLQGRTNSTATNVNLKIYNAGSTTIISEQTALASDANGNVVAFQLRLPAGNYDFRLKTPCYLSSFLANKTLASPMALNFGTQRAGDFDNNNLVNGLDFAPLNNKWFSTDAILDLNSDGIINGVDFSIMNTNWFATGA